MQAVIPPDQSINLDPYERRWHSGGGKTLTQTMDVSLAVSALADQVPVVGMIVLGAVVGLVALVAGLRRRRAEQPVPELTEFAIAAYKLCKSYPGGGSVSDDITFRLRPGTVVGLLGPNGAGKTTLLSMIAGLVAPDSGAVYLFGHRVCAGAPVLSRIGLAIEQPGLVPHMTGREMLRTTWAVTGRPDVDAHMDLVIDISGLDAKSLDRKISGYSMGMRQRLAVAQAMLGLPELLVLDEPANGLDPAQIRRLREALRTYASGGRTVLVSSHVLPEMERICEEVLVLHRGRLVLSTPVDASVRASFLQIVLHGAGTVAEAEKALHANGTEFTRVSDNTLDVPISASTPIAPVLRALADADCVVQALHTRSAFEDMYYTAVSDG